jgi:predicted small integral membrane protein
MGWVFLAIGMFSLCGGVFNWDWFMTHEKAQFFVRMFGRRGTRMFYGLFGSALVVLGILMVTGTARPFG